MACAVSIGPREKGGFGLAVKPTVEDQLLQQEELQALVDVARELICPYTHAMRNNVDVQLEVIGG